MSFFFKISRRVIIIVFLSLLCGNSYVRAQVDTSFWFAAPFFNCNHGADAYYKLVVFSQDVPVTVTVSMPANPHFVPIVRTIDAYSYTDIVLARGKLAGDTFLTTLFDTITNRGLLITSTGKVECYYHVTGLNSEAFTLKGNNALGTNFLATGQKSYNNGQAGSRYSIHIVATEDSTEVRIALSNPVLLSDGGYFYPDTPIVVVLNKGETYGVASYYNLGLRNLAGTVITSNNPIAVTINDDSVMSPEGSCQDDIGEQLVPTNFAGTEYVVLTGGYIYDMCTIFALNDNTQVTTSDGFTDVINKGDYREISLRGREVLYISTSKPVMVFQVLSATESSCELGGTALPAIRCTGSSHAAYKPYNTSSGTRKCVYLVTTKDNIYNFTINGSSYSYTNFQPVVGSDEYYYSLYRVSYANDINVECSSGVFQMGVSEGDATGSCTVGFFSDYGEEHNDEYGLLGYNKKFVWEGHYLPGTTTPRVYTRAGEYHDTIYSASGCRRISSLHLTNDDNGIENIEDVECSAQIDSPGFWIVNNTGSGNTGFGAIKIKKSSEAKLNTSLIPLVGDIDDDGISEILCFSSENAYYGHCPTKINIMNGITLQVIRQIDIKEPVYDYSAGVYGIVKLPNRHTMLVVTTMNNHLVGYDLSSNSNTYTWRTDLPSDMRYYSNISFADFNNDGYPEIYLGNRIYDAETGVLVLAGSGNSGKSYAYEKTLLDGDYHYVFAPFAADMDLDGFLDLIVGNEIYKIDITNRNGQVGNTMSLYKSITPPLTFEPDGHTQVADFNLDGHLDVLISNKPDPLDESIYLYVWDVFNDRTIPMWPPRETDGGKGLPVITDINGDGKIDIIIYGDAPYHKFLAYTYNTNDEGDEEFDYLGMIEMIDEIAVCSNALSAFDFNQDGISELLYIDQSSLKIFNGSGKSHITGNDTVRIYAMSSYPIGGGTVMQYPVVADVDNDGSAEILTIGKWNAQGTSTSEGNLYVFTSAGRPWAPARSVWNQYMYNVFNIKADLTTPTVFYDATVSFKDPDDLSIIRRPFNNFFQQSTTIDRYGRYVNRASDIVARWDTLIIACDYLEILLDYCNMGERELHAPYKITTYANTYHGTVLSTDVIDSDVAVGECTQTSIKIPKTVIENDDTIYKLVLAINDGGMGVAQQGNQQAECDTTNNVFIIDINIRNDTNDTTVFTPVICVTDLPYTHVESGITFPIGTTTGTDSFKTLTNRYGCDSVIVVKLTIYPVLYGDTTAYICGGQSFTWWDSLYSDEDDYQRTYQSVVTGCDSIVTLHLKVYPVLYGDTTVYICGGQSFTWWDNVYSVEDDYQRLYKSVVTGCDSIVTLHLKVYPILYGDTTAYICSGQSFMWWDSVCSDEEDYQRTYQSVVMGCDSIVTLHLKVYPTLYGDTFVSISQGMSFTWWDSVYSDENDYQRTYQSVVTGCDSIITLHLTIKPFEYTISASPQCADAPYVEFDIIGNNTDVPYQLQFAFSQQARVQHFRDTVVMSSQSSVLIPNRAGAGVYDVDISPIYNNTIIDTPRHCQFTLLYPISVLEQHWNDFIGVLTPKYNGGYDFVSFQWYKNGIPLVGENRSYLYQPLEMGANYSVLLVQTDGTQLMTCDIVAVPQEEISLYPTLAHPRQSIRLYTNEEVSIWLYNSVGALLSFQSFDRGEHILSAPLSPGVYIIKVQYSVESNKTKIKKLVIR